MTDLLYQLTTRPPLVKMIWALLFILTISSMFNFIIIFDEDTKKFKAIITTLTIFLGFLGTFTLLNKHIGDSVKHAINDKKYTLKINENILELTSGSPYLKSNQFKIVYQDNSKIKVEYHDEYYDIDKTKEKIDATNWLPSES